MFMAEVNVMSKKSRFAARARRNGAQSHGPVTAAGKAVSSRNAVTHGLAARRPVLLQDEDPAAYETLRQAYYLKFTPQDPVEQDLVDEMVAARWQLRRCHSVETSLLELERAKTLAEARQAFPNIDPIGAVAYAFQSLADDSKSLELLRRYRTAHARDFQRALDTLLRLRRELAEEFEEDSDEAAQTPAAQSVAENVQTNPGSPGAAAPPPGEPVPDGKEGRLIEFPEPPKSKWGPIIPYRDSPTRDYR